jgi:hypothetical protein
MSRRHPAVGRRDAPARRTTAPLALRSAAVAFLRIAFLVFLAALLPARGALAAAMPCAGMPAPAPVTVSQHAMHAMDAAHAVEAPQPGTAHHAEHAHHGHSAAGDVSAAGDATAADDGSGARCDLCGAACSLPALPSAAPSVAAAASVDVRRSAPTPAVPRHAADGRERPPRTT